MSPWNNDKVINRLCYYISKGHSFSKVAELLNEEFNTKFTRNSIIGKWRRFTTRFYGDRL